MVVHYEWVEEQETASAEACPGCGCMPGDGLTKRCWHPAGCGFWRFEHRRAREAQIVAGGPRPLRFPDVNPEYGFYLVHLDTHPAREGQWRVTRFNAELEPTGHTECGTFESAVHEAAAHGADLFTPNPEAMEG
jgi:hypothetical protein